MSAIRFRMLPALVALSAAAALVGCGGGYGGAPVGSTGGGYPATQTSYPAASQVQHGRVSNVQLVRAGQSSGVAGAVVGGAVGGLAGHQVGGGKGRTAATIAGTLGGALVGMSLEKNMQGAGQDVHRVTVQFDNGSVRHFDYGQAPNVRVGDRVWMEGEQLYR